MALKLMNRNPNSQEHFGFGLGTGQGAESSARAPWSLARAGREDPEGDLPAVAARMDYIIVTFSSYYFSQVVSDLCLLGKSAVFPPLSSSDKCFSSPFSRGSVLPRIELGSWATSFIAGLMAEGLLFLAL